MQLGFNDGYSSLTRLGAKIFENTISGGASLIRSRINSANGNQVISIGASSTGDFVDAAGEDVISGDDMYCVAFVPGAATGTVRIGSITDVKRCIYASGVAQTPLYCPNGSGIDYNVASVTRFALIAGWLYNLTYTEAIESLKIQGTGAFRGLQVKVLTNARTTATVFKIRKNAADSAVTVSVGATLTGIFENNTAEAAVVNNDTVALAVTTGTGTESLVVRHLYCYYRSLTGVGLTYHGSTYILSQVLPSITKYFSIANSITGLGEFYIVSRSKTPLTFSHMQVLVDWNTLTSASTIRFRKNGTNGNMNLSITASTTGTFEDDVNTDNVSAEVDICYAIETVAGGTEMYFKLLTCETTELLVQTFPITINETGISLADTLLEKLSARRTISESAISIGASAIVRRVERPITETGISLTETLRRFKVKRIASETTISLADTITKRLSAKRTISETGISFGDTLTGKLKVRKIITETGISLTETLQRLKVKRITSESAISLVDTITRRLSAKRTTTESGISLDDTLSRRLSAKRAITEADIIVDDTLSKILSTFREITELGEGIADSVSSLAHRVGIITEDAIDVADSILVYVKRTLEDLVIIDDDSLAVTPPVATVTSSILTTSRGNFGATGATTAGATQYWFLGNGMLFPSATEANRQFPWHSPGVFSKLYIRVIASTTSADSTVVLRKNGVDQLLKITIGAGYVGALEDTVNEIAIADGDNVCFKTVSGGTGTLTFSIMSVLFKADSGSTITKEIAMGRAATTSASTQYVQITGDRSGSSAVEANMESRMKAPGVYKNASLYVSANAKTTSTVVTFRKNRTDTAITWTIAAGFTGIKEDTTNTVSVAAEDEIDWKIIYATDTANITIENFGIDFESTDRIHFPVAGSAGATSDITQDFGTTNYYVVGGAMREITAESEQKLKTRLRYTYFGLTLHAQVNTCNGATTIKFRKNGADGNQSITIPASTAGWQSDDINLDPVDTIDEIDIQVTTAGTSGTVTIRNMSLMSEGALAGVAYFRTITESSETLDDTLTSIARQLRTIIEGTIAISDSVTRKIVVRLTTSEPAVSISDTITVSIAYLKTITEGAISIADSILLRVRLTITEIGISLVGLLSKKVTFRHLISNTVIINDTISITRKLRKAISEVAVSISDSLTVRSRRIITNSVSISDSLTRKLTSRHIISEAPVILNDTVSLKKKLLKTISEITVSISDSLIRRLSARRTMTESAQSIADLLLRRLSSRRTISEAPVVAGDTISIIKKIQKTITEGVVSISDSLAIRVRRIITQSVSISDLLSEKLTSRHIISETPVVAGDTISVMKKLHQVISEGAVSISDSLTLKVRRVITIIESPKSIADSITRRVTTRLTITELAVSLSGTLTRKYYSLRTILEGAIPITDTLNVLGQKVISDILIVSDSITRRLRLTINELEITIVDNIPLEILYSRRIIDNSIPASDILSKRLSAKRTIDEIGETVSDYLLVTFAYFASITEPAIEIADNIPIIRVFKGIFKKGRRFFRHLGFGSTSLRRG